MNTMRFRLSTSKGQRGAVLIVGMVLLLMMTMLGLTSMQGTIQQERMTGNLRDRELAFQASEAALRAGEGFIATRTEASLNPGYYGSTPPTWTVASDGSWANSAKTEEFPVVTAQPQYMVEKLANIPIGGSLEAAPSIFKESFRVYARGQGGRDETVVTLLSTTFRIAND